MTARQRAQRVRRAATIDPPTELGCACASARRVARVLTQLYDRQLRTAGIEAPQFALMATLAQQGPCGQTALGTRHALDKTTASRNLGRLERKGWIAASRGSDRRERRVALTAAGRRQLTIARPEWKKAQDQLRSQIDARQWDEVFRAFRTITEAAQKATAELF